MDRFQHTVIFRLNDGVDEEWFLDQARTLADLPGVQDFEVLEQVSTKTEQFRFALSMWFDDAAGHAAYDANPSHIDYVQNIWLPNVAEFVELDYIRR